MPDKSRWTLGGKWICSKEALRHVQCACNISPGLITLFEPLQELGIAGFFDSFLDR